MNQIPDDVRLILDGYCASACAMLLMRHPDACIGPTVPFVYFHAISGVSCVEGEPKKEILEGDTKDVCFFASSGTTGATQYIA